MQDDGSLARYFPVFVDVLWVRWSIFKARAQKFPTDGFPDVARRLILNPLATPGQ